MERIKSIVLIFLLLGGNANSQSIPDSLDKYIYEISCTCKTNDKDLDRNGKSMRFVGVKLKGQRGILTVLHGAIHCDPSKPIIAMIDDTVQDIRGLKIYKFDADNDACLLKLEDDQHEIMNSKFGLFNSSIEDAPSNDFILTSIQNKTSDSEAIEIPRETNDHVWNKKKITDKIEEVKKFFNPNQYENVSPMIVISNKELYHGMSGSPLLYKDDKNRIHVVGILHGGRIDGRCFSVFIQPENLKWRDFVYGKDYTGIKAKWGVDQIENGYFLSSFLPYYKKVDYEILNKIQSRLEGIENSERAYWCFNSFDKKVIKAIASLSYIDDDQWIKLQKKGNKRLAKGNEDLHAMLHNIITRLAFTETGLADAVIGDTSCIDSLHFLITNIASNSTGKDAKTLLAVGNKLTTEIEDYRAVYTNVLALRKEGLNPENTISDRLYSFNQARNIPQPLINELRRRSQYGDYGQNHSISILLSTLIQLDQKNIKSFDSLQAISLEQSSQAIQFIMHLAEQDSIEEAGAIIDFILTNTSLDHIFFKQKEKLNFLKDSLNIVQSNYLQPNEIAPQLNRDLNILYNNILYDSGINGGNLLPFIDAEIKSVNVLGGGSANKASVRFINESKTIAPNSSDIYPVSSITNFPRGVANLGMSNNNNAHLSAQLITQYAFSLDSLFNHYKDFFDVDLEMQMHIIGMADGHAFPGLYNEKNEYSKDKISKFKSVSILQNIQCYELALNYAINKNPRQERTKPHKERHWIMNVPYNEIGNYGDQSYENNMKLATNRARFFGELLQDYMRAFPDDVRYNFWACQVPQKQGACRRTEVGIEISWNQESTSKKVQSKQDFSIVKSQFLRHIEI